MSSHGFSVEHCHNTDRIIAQIDRFDSLNSHDKRCILSLLCAGMGKLALGHLLLGAKVTKIKDSTVSWFLKWKVPQ